MGLNGTFGDVVSVKRWYPMGEEEAPHLTMAKSSSVTRDAGLLHSGGPLVDISRRLPFSQLKTAVIFPGSLMKTTADTLVRAYEGSSILCCSTSSGYQVGLLFGTGQPSAEQPFLYAPGTWYLVYCYGNGMRLETSCYEFAQFRQLGFNVLIPEYPGYGMSSGQASESGCYEVADAAYRYLTETLHVHPAQIVIAGWRLQCRRSHRSCCPQAGCRFDRTQRVHQPP